MESIWKKAKSAVKRKIPAHSYRMWIEPVVYDRREADAVVVLCPNFFSRKRVLDHYGHLLREELRAAAGEACRLVVEIGRKSRRNGGKPGGSSRPEESERPRISDAPKTAPAERPRRTSTPPSATQLALPGGPAPLSFGRIMRKNYTFDRFVVGQNNRFAYSAALGLASESKCHHHSLFLSSETGLGKSHLSQAIGHHILNHFPTENVFYITAEDFTNEMVQAFRGGAIDQFKEKYRRKCDVLLLEDVHFLTGKERTQIELALALDDLLNADKKLIFTSSCLPANIPRLNDQLRSRLSGGLISNIEKPDFATRVQILQRKMVEHGIQLPRSLIEYLAAELSDNVRQLESGLIGISARVSLAGERVDMRLAQDVVRNITSRSRSITVESIKALVCRHYGVSAEELESRSRKKRIVRPRQMAIYLARKYTDQSLQAIGRSFNRYHATAIHSIGAVEKGVKADASLKQQLHHLCGQLESGDI
ncbi:MAG: chromosomal replication initiator protein DnaA [Desulfococcaceae bacterium]